MVPWHLDSVHDVQERIFVCLFVCFEHLRFGVLLISDIYCHDLIQNASLPLVWTSFLILLSSAFSFLKNGRTYIPQCYFEVSIRIRIMCLIVIELSKHYINQFAFWSQIFSFQAFLPLAPFHGLMYPDILRTFTSFWDHWCLYPGGSTLNAA